MAMIDELIEAVSRAAALPPAQAARAVDAMLRFSAARLPSPLFGELQSRLQGTPETPDAAAPAGPGVPGTPGAFPTSPPNRP